VTEFGWKFPGEFKIYPINPVWLLIYTRFKYNSISFVIMTRRTGIRYVIQRVHYETQSKFHFVILIWVGTTVVGRGSWLTLTSHITSCDRPVSSVENGRVLVYCVGVGNISEAIASINQITLRRVAQNMVKQVNACIQENGGHYQHLLRTVFQVLLYCSITKWNFGCVLKWTSCRKYWPRSCSSTQL
jgi:hypothetical protein